MGNEVYLKLPGHIFSEAAQDLRDSVADWLEAKHVQEDDYDSYYFVIDDKQNGNQFGASNPYGRATHICYSFSDSRLAVMFKLTFG